MPFGLIDELLRRGEIALWHRYDQGTFHDFSGHGNEPTTFSNVRLEGGGLKFNAENGYLIVPDAPSIRCEDGTLICHMDWRSRSEYTGVGRIVSKRDVGGYGYAWGTSGGDFSFYSGASWPSVTYGPCEVAAVTYESGGTPVGFADGVSVGNYSGTVTTSDDDADLIIGNYYSYLRHFHGVMFGLVIINRPLIESDVAQITGELMELRG